MRPKTGRWAARLERKSSRGRGGAASSTRWGPQEAPPFKIWQPPPWVLAVCSSNLWDFAPMFRQSLSWVISDRREQSGVWAGMAPQLVAAFLLALSPPKRTLLEAPFSRVLLYRGPWRRRGRKATIRRMKAEPCPNTFPSVGLIPALGRLRRGAGAGSRAVGASLCSSHPAALPRPRIPGDNPSSPAPSPAPSCQEEALEQSCSFLTSSPCSQQRCCLAQPSRSSPPGSGVAQSLSQGPGPRCPAVRHLPLGLCSQPACTNQPASRSSSGW